MTKVDIFSGFLGAGKTTLIRKLIEEAYGDEKIVLIENEFGEIGVDKGFLKNTGIQINQMNAGCICCTLVGDFGKALNEVIEQYHPDRILIEPSGVGKLSDVIIAVQDLENDEIQLNGFTTVVDAKKAKMYLKNFGEFYVNQVEHASSIILSHVQGLSQEKIDQVIGLLREHNQEASIVTTDWKDISGKKILETMEQKKTLSAELDHLREEAYREQAEHEAEHHHHDHDHDHDECCCHDDHDEHHDHHHDDEDEVVVGCCGHVEHVHHHHDEDHDEHHHHDHDEDCGCGHHHHHHHHHGHDADEVFDEFGVTTAHKYTKEQIENALAALQNEEECGQVLRSKGIVEGTDGKWYQFDYVPGEPEVREGEPEATGMVCVIGVGLAQDHIKELFGLN
ncbi:MAG: GTP-binding protein [Eubacteriales bacterium]|nr:GTP-binding protein [Eubacteriales bacterium]